MQNLVAMTGATGFVGGHVLAALLASGRKVRVLVRDASKFENADRVDVVEGDLQDLAALEKLVMGAGAVIHCAGAIAARNRDGFFKVNEAGVQNIAKAAVTAKVERFILVSSLAAREAYLSDYAASKRAGEEVATSLIAKEQLTIVRPPAVYGPGDKATLPLIKALTQNRAILPGREDQKISLLYVEDLADLLVYLVDNSPDNGAVLEVDDGFSGGYGFADLTRLAGEAQGKQVCLTLLPRSVVAMAGLVAGLGAKLFGIVSVLSPAKVRELYHPDWVAGGVSLKGWQPKVQFKEGFVRALGWYQENQWLPDKGTVVKSQKI